MAGFYGTTGMWYKNGTFYELDDTHVNFFLQHPEKLGFSQEEKQQMCIANNLPPDAETRQSGRPISRRDPPHERLESSHHHGFRRLSGFQPDPGK